MSYSYNSSAKYRPSDGYDAVVTASELTRLKIVVQDDGNKSAGFDVKFNIDLFFRECIQIHEARRSV